MNLSEFRTAHSVVMEHYQFIEMHLEGIYAALSGRSFWTHSCYTNMVFDRKTGGPKKETDIGQLYQDTREAEQMRDLLFEKKIKLMEIVRDKHTF